MSHRIAAFATVALLCVGSAGEARAQTADLVVVNGTHAGKSGIVRDRNTSKTGHVTITVEQADGVRFKTLARNVSTQR